MLFIWIVNFLFAILYNYTVSKKMCQLCQAVVLTSMDKFW